MYLGNHIKFWQLKNELLIVIAVLLTSIAYVTFSPNPVSAATTLCSTTTATIAQTSAPIIYIDDDVAPLLDSVYVSYDVATGASVSFTDLWVQLENFSSVNLALATNEDGLYHVGPLGLTSSSDVYFYLTGTETASAQSYDVVLYDGHPTYGGTETCYENRSHASVDDTIKAVSNKVTSVVSTAPYVGGSMTITVTGDTGVIGAAGIFNYTPASVSTWPADCYELYDANMVLTGGNVGSHDDILYLSGLNSPTTHYVQTYYFTAKCTTALDTAVTPLNNISSGTKIKHTSTDTATYTSIPPIPPAENQLNLTKSVSPGGSAGGGTATYTVTAHNDSPVPITIDYFQDTIPSSPASVTYTASSSEWDAVTIAEPDISGQVLTWTDLFTVAAGATKDLTYDVTIPATNGNFVNSAVAFVGATQIDLTKDTSDDSPATATYGVGDPNFGTSTKTSVDANAGDLVPTDTISYTLTLINSGTIDATEVDVDDVIDTNTDTLTNIVIAASGSDCGSSYTDNSTGTALDIDDLDIATATNCIITFDVTVKAGTADQTSILNTATISAAVEGGVGGSPSSNPLTVDVDPFLTLAKTENDADNDVTPGQTITYTVTVGNTGLADATGVDIDDTIGGSAPINIVDNFTYTNCGADYVDASSGLVIDIDNVDVGTALDCVVTYDVTVDGTAVDTETITNSVDVGAANEGGNDPGSVAASTLTVVVGGLDPVLGVTKVENDADDVVSPGQTVTYTVTIANTGTETGTTSFTDTIDTDYGSPGNYGFTNCGGAEGTAFVDPTLTISNLVVTTALDCVVTYDLVVDNPSDEGTTLTNSADVAQAAEGGNNPSPVSATTLTVDATPDLSGSTKAENDADNVVTPGQAITYTLTIINSGDGTATGVDVTDNVDTDAALDTGSVGFANCGSSYTDNSISSQLNIIDLEIAVGVNCVIMFDLDVDNPSVDGNTIPNSATISASDEGGSGGTPSATTQTIDVTPALGVTKVENDADNIVTPGQTVTYTVTISNTGDGTATTSFTDAIDVDYGSPGNYGFTNCGGSEGSAFAAPTLTISSLVITTAADCVVTYDLVVDSPSDEGTTLTNSADVAQAAEGGNDLAPVSATTLTVNATPSLGVTKIENDADNVVTPGQTVTYTVTISNTGDGSASTSFTDTIDVDYGSPGNYGFTNCGGGEGTAFAAPTLTISSLVITTAADCVVTYDLVVDNPSDEGTALTNSADIAAASEGGNNPSPVSATTLTVDATPTLVVSKTDNDGDNVVTPGQAVTYTVNIQNTGDGTASTSFTDTIDTDVGSPGSYGYTACGGLESENFTAPTLTISSLAIASGSTCIVTYIVAVDNPSTEGATITNSANVAQATEGGNDPSSESSDTLTIDVTPALGVTKVENDADNIVTPGQTVTYTVTISNTGDGTATTSFTDAIDVDYGSPGNYGFTNCGGSEGSAFAAPTLTISSLVITTAADCVVTYDLVVDSPSDEGTTLTNSADVAQAAEGGNNPAQVSATTLTVNATPSLALTKVDDDADNTVSAGQTITYTLTLVNTGDGTATGVDINDSPTGDVSTLNNFTFTNCGSSYTNNSAGTTVDIDDVEIAVGTNCVVTYDITVAAGATGGNTITNSADATASVEGGNDPAADGADTLTVAIIREIDLIKTLKSVTQLNIVDFVVVYEFSLDSFSSNVTLTNVQVTDSLSELEANGAVITSTSVVITNSFASGGTANGSYDGDSDTALLAGAPSGARLDKSGGADTTASLEVTVNMTRPINTTVPANTATATADGGVSDVSDSDGFGEDGNNDTDPENDPAPTPTPDADNDYFIDGAESTTDDRDNDGIVDSQDFDPQGYFYCQADGRIISGGQVQVSGPASVTMIEDGSQGHYQWFATVPGTYTMTYTNPPDSDASPDRTTSGTLDPTGNPNPYSIGSNEFGTTNILSDYSASANPYYLVFDIEAGDPWIINNNLPFTNCASLANTGDLALISPILGALLLVSTGFASYMVRKEQTF